MFTNRNVADAGPASNQAYGVDAAFAFYQNVADRRLLRAHADGRTSAATTRATRASSTGCPTATACALEYTEGRRRLQPGGRLPAPHRLRARRSRRLRFSPRPKGSTHVRKYTWQASTRVLRERRRRRSRRAPTTGRFNTEFNNSDQLNVEDNDNYDVLAVPFSPAAASSFRSAATTSTTSRSAYNLGQQRRVSGTIRAQVGQFYDGTIRAMPFGTGRVSITKRSRSSRASRSTTSTCRAARSPPGCYARAPTTASRRACS